MDFILIFCIWSGEVNTTLAHLFFTTKVVRSVSWWSTAPSYLTYKFCIMLWVVGVIGQYTWSFHLIFDPHSILKSRDVKFIGPQFDLWYLTYDHMFCIGSWEVESPQFELKPVTLTHMFCVWSWEVESTIDLWPLTFDPHVLHIVVRSQESPVHNLNFDLSHLTYMFCI